MTLKRSGTWLMALCAAAGFGCTDTGSTQVLTGRVGTQGAIGVRAIAGDNVVTAARVRSDGSFTIALPTSRDYRLEVMTSSGVRHVLMRKGGSLQKLSFDVCQPVDPFDIGGIGRGMDPGNPGTGGGGGPPIPPDCNPMTDPNCGPIPPKCAPGDSSCDPLPPCVDPMGAGENCPPPPPCMDPNDPYCKCNANGQCPPPDCGMGSGGPNGMGSSHPGDPTGGVCPPPPPPPCGDPRDPNSCKDPCMDDPAQCGCATGEPNCWPMPEPPKCDGNGRCEPNGMAPDHPPGDFGCKESVGR